MTSGLVVECSNNYATEPCENTLQFFNIYEKNLKISFLKFKNKILDFQNNF